jgi:Domain of unknown function (DUF4193)
LADDTQQREADEREYEDDSDDLNDLDGLEGGAEDQDESPAEAEDDEDESAGAEGEDDLVVSLDDELQQASLEQPRDQRVPRKRLDPDDDEELLALVSDADEPHGEAAPARVTPIKSRQEFVCARCRLVKPRVQLADPARGLCRDCA